MHRRMRRPRVLKVRRYAARMSDMNEYLAVLPGSKTSAKYLDEIE